MQIQFSWSIHLFWWLFIKANIQLIWFACYRSLSNPDLFRKNYWYMPWDVFEFLNRVHITVEDIHVVRTLCYFSFPALDIALFETRTKLQKSICWVRSHCRLHIIRTIYPRLFSSWNQRTNSYARCCLLSKVWFIQWFISQKTC